MVHAELITQRDFLYWRGAGLGLPTGLSRILAELIIRRDFL
jgi:hypothetical protein